MKNRKILVITLGIVFVLVGGIVIAYAALSTKLTTKFNKVATQSLTWDVGFNQHYNTLTSPIYTNGTVTSYYFYTKGSPSGNASCGNATIGTTTVTVTEAIELEAEGDKCRYDLEIKNSGDIDALLSRINPIEPSSSCSANGSTMVCGNITYKITTDSSGYYTLGSNITLSARGTKKVYLIVEYTGSSQTSADWSGGGFDLYFTQK